MVIDAVPLLPGYRWHWVARWFWRRRLVGELANATISKAGVAAALGPGDPRRGRMPEEFIELVWRGRWPGSWPEMLTLYRSADPERLAQAGERLGSIGAPALVVWGPQDLLPLSFGRAYAEQLPNAELLELTALGTGPDRSSRRDRPGRRFRGGLAVPIRRSSAFTLPQHPVRAFTSRINGFLPGRARRRWQFALFFLAYNGYQVVRGITDGGRDVAFANADRLIDVERSLGTYFEAASSRRCSTTPAACRLANFMYLTAP